MFIEAPALVSEVLKKNWDYKIMRWDTVAVRIHQSTAQNKDYYLKMWKSSPIEEWRKLGGYEMLRDYTSLIQIKNNYKNSAVFKECFNFVKYKFSNICNPGFLFFACIAIFTPRWLLRKLPHIYRRTLGRWTTGEIKRT